MLPKYHIALGLIFSLSLFLVFPYLNLLACGIIWLSSFLIDGDHYIYYLFRTGKFNPLKSVKYFFDKRDKMRKLSNEELRRSYPGFYFLHGLESLMILFILGTYVSRFFFLIFTGFSFHLILDWVDEIRSGKRIDKISSIYDFIKFQKLNEIK